MAIFDYALTTDGDLDLDTICEPIQVIEDDAIVQIARQHLKLWVGNWFRNTAYGTDWKSILRKNITPTFVGQVIAQSLLQLDFVTSVIDTYVDVDRVKRTAVLTTLFIADGKEYKISEEL
jgi:hypothetical protein